ncbi:hypothetical protein RND71_041428 [Anisodus tanguticus]|uniref:RNase H type-1 domain-containing protein n=1 Tax=Anisodus tanguticus TaxID=243964 RepID=A0AAE1QV31_9SOLA|nr:hypothetical protein RND71_041428 [Anisodus tanguticus]
MAPFELSESDVARISSIGVQTRRHTPPEECCHKIELTHRVSRVEQAVSLLTKPLDRAVQAELTEPSKSLIVDQVPPKVLNKKFGRARIREGWHQICTTCDAVIEQRISKIVKWIKPSSQTVKLNRDGSCTQGMCGGGGIVRNNQGRVIFAYSIPLVPGTSNIAEAAAMLFGLKWCATNGFKSALGETDSLLITNYIRREWKMPWKISNYINGSRN